MYFSIVDVILSLTTLTLIISTSSIIPSSGLKFPPFDPTRAPNANGAALKRKYDAAHSKGGGQEAYNIKKEARAAGVDVKSW